MGKELPKPKGEEWRDNRGEESCNKGGHKERSIANQPNHQEHWREVEKREKKEEERKGKK
jgi:hypothetical protein